MGSKTRPMSTQASSTATRLQNRASASGKQPLLGRENRMARILSHNRQREGEEDGVVEVEIHCGKLNEETEETERYGMAMPSATALTDTKNLLQNNAMQNKASQGRAGLLRAATQQVRRQQAANPRIFNSATAMNDYQQQQQQERSQHSMMEATPAKNRSFKVLVSTPG